MRAGIALEPAHALLRRMAAREVSPLDVVEACEAAYRGRNADLNAVVTPTFERARAEAAAAERRFAEGRARPLEGLPLAVKDSIPTAGVRTTYGSTLFRENVPPSDALHVARLRAAGAIVVGKTNTPELEVGINTRNALFGQTVNPHDATRGAGGSSGGSAVALAAGMCAIADGTDHGGSIRIPASVVGVVGMRPSPGRVPLYPSSWVYDDLSVPGALARTARDVALMLSAMSGPDSRVPTSRAAIAAPSTAPDVRGWRVGWSVDLGGLLSVDAEVASAIQLAARRLAELGCEVEEAAPDWRDAMAIIGPLRAHRTAVVMDALRDRVTAISNPWLLEFIARADGLSLGEIGRAEAARSRYWERTAAFFQRYRLLLIPSTQWPAFHRELDFPTTVGGRAMSGVVEAILATYAVTIAGLPAMSIPCAVTSRGLPIGVQIVGGWLGDEDVIAAGIAFDETFSGSVRPTA